MTQHDDSEQLAWDFDVSVDGTAEPEITVDADGDASRLVPGSERWIAALQSTDADAMRLNRLDVSLLSAEAAPAVGEGRGLGGIRSDRLLYRRCPHIVRCGL